MSCSKCRSATCNGCCNKSACSGVPYYQQADVCIEDHCLTVQQPEFSFSVCPTSSWNVPLCGQTAVLSVPGLVGATVGSFIWHPQFGYFEINSVDTVNGQLGITNPCREGNAAVGTQIPACTCFIVTDPPSAIPVNETGDCVAIDFTAPEEDMPLDIILTATTGITVGDTVQIGTGFYFVEAVKPDNIITIVNKGEGITPGTPVIAKDANGDFQFCLSIISTNPCDRTPIKDVVLLGCNTDGVTVPLKGLNDGWVVTNDGFNTDEHADRPLGATSAECTILSADLVLQAAVANYANVEVSDSSVFVVGDVLEVEGGVGFRFAVTNVPDGTHIDVTVSPIPGSIVTFPNGSIICLQSCCDTLQTEIDCIVQGTRLTIPPALYLQTITMSGSAGSTFEVTLDSNVIQFTAPSDCPGSTYHVRAEVNVAGLVDRDEYSTFQPGGPFQPGDKYPSVLSSEIQLDWDNNPGVGGRFNWTDVFGDGLTTALVYPPTTLNAIWGPLQVLSGLYPITYAGAYVIADTLVASGNTITLRLNYKAIDGDNYPPDTVTSVGVYIIGNLVITKVI